MFRYGSDGVTKSPALRVAQREVDQEGDQAEILCPEKEREVEGEVNASALPSSAPPPLASSAPVPYGSGAGWSLT